LQEGISGVDMGRCKLQEGFWCPESAVNLP